MAFDPNKMRKKLQTHISLADKELSEKFSEELGDLSGFSDEMLAEFSGTTEQLDSIISELKKAVQQNLSQAKFVENVKSLGASTYNLAKKISDLVP